MSSTDIQLKKALKNLGKIPGKIQKRVVNGALRAGSVEVQKEAIKAAPEDTGELKDGIKIQKMRQKSFHSKATYRLGLAPDVWYGVFTHQGTPTIKPVPFMTIGYEAGGDRALKRMQEYMKRRVEKEIKKL